jgi:biotin synthase
MPDWAKISIEASKGKPPKLDQAAKWLQPGSWADLMDLMAAANRVRQAALGDGVEFCSIVNAKSGHCSEDCAFCAQSRHHSARAQAYPLMAPGQIVSLGMEAARAGVRRFSIVTSGRSAPKGAELAAICRAGSRLREEAGVLPCCSLGLLDRDQARQLKSAGFVRYHHNLEAGPGYFAKICSTHAYEDRIRTIEAAKEAGLEVCAGGIVGMGESPLERAGLARAISGLGVDSLPLNFLSPIPGTPLAALSPISCLEALAAVAVFRLFNPGAHIRTCGGRHQILGSLSPLMYLAGASATMTGNYLTTSGPTPQSDRAEVLALGLKLEAA